MQAIRAAIQRSKAPLKEQAARYGLNRKTVAKWRKRGFLHDAPMCPKAPCSTVLTAQEEATAVAFRKHTLLPLDDCLYEHLADLLVEQPGEPLGEIGRALRVGLGRLRTAQALADEGVAEGRDHGQMHHGARVLPIDDPAGPGDP